MTGRNARTLAARLMTAQVAVIIMGSATLALTAGLVAPGLFHRHLSEAGVSSGSVSRHAEEAFASALIISLTVAALGALITAGVASWILVRRVVQPFEQLALAADAVAAGRYDLRLPQTPFSSELERLSGAFSHMATRLADTDATRSRLLSDLSHELRTPLATLSACIDAMEDGVLPVDSTSWQTLRDQLTRLRRLSEDVRVVAAAEEQSLGLRLGPTDLVAVTRSAVTAATPRAAARGVHLAYRGDQSAPRVHADPERLGQVLSNLLDNAVRHTPRGGHITASVQTRPGQLLLRVEDDGNGIPADQLEAIFERFHRADPARADTDGSGSGLGLTIARAIIRGHGGTITAASAGPNRGAIFTVTLPRTAHT